ncbi:putative NBD/HSP70 family sugar kinase [Microbacterium sp. AG157]|uniref:ROK family protein n=1 Tax=Microbacterium TaxID=33882 RepID=UPI000CCF8065|nr:MULTISPECIES: ROK family protein [Microbacterium]PNW09165.1 ROK family protein [Microbacterium testaceum]REC97795.1 putative NBD/HSP70 family sugar kinase [Microbacterium sp. AG157]WJS90785.1 ROK family protein [Microbacterium testaceum]
MANVSTLRFGAQTDEVTSLLRIVNMVRSGDAVTRPEIGRVTGLGRGVVAQRVDRAVEMGFLEDAEYAPSSGGRAPRTLRFRAERGRIVVCALGGQHIHVGVTDLDGTILDEAHRAWNIASGPEETLDTATAMVDDLLASGDGTPVWAIVVGLPGPVDFETGRPVAPPIMPGWNGFDVRGAFEQRYGAPVWVDNDVNLLAAGERARHRDEGIDLIYCKVGTGIGAGLVSHGRLHRGANGAAGDMGHVRVPGAEQVCRCGKIGCLEAVAGGWALVRDAHEAIERGATGVLADSAASGTDLTLESITIAATRGDALATSLVQTSARQVGEAIAALVNMFNPSLIVIGGAVASTGELFLAEVRHRVYELSLPLATRDLVIRTSESDAREPVRGGVDLAQEQLFEVSLPRWFADGRPTVAAVHGLFD